MTTALPEIARLRHAACVMRATQDDMQWPQDEAFARAGRCVREIIDDLKPGAHGAWWSEPHVSLTPEGEVSLSWTFGPRQLFVYVEGSGAVSVRVSGTSINEDMKFEDYPSSSAFPRLWRWLLHGDAWRRAVTDELRRVAFTKPSEEARGHRYYRHAHLRQRMETTKFEFQPSSVPPPGETLIEYMNHHNISEETLAARMSRPVEFARELLAGRAKLSVAVAAALERATGVPQDFWLERERQYRSFLDKSPEELVGALQDRVHRESGAMRAAKSVRVRNGR